jgi:transcriptional regulator with XRE-family HTH domain
MLIGRSMPGAELGAARHKANLTREQAAAGDRISREHVSQLERHRQSPTADNLLRVCRILAKVEEAGPGGRP